MGHRQSNVRPIVCRIGAADFRALERTMSGQSLLVILLVGLIAGWLAGKIVRGTGFGLVADLCIGIIGAFIGDWLLPRLGIWLGYGVRHHRRHRWRHSPVDRSQAHQQTRPVVRRSGSASAISR
jgi:uncharacterized membrane protein YeaQ/YmgE (transglycosylase-associated protein family)